MSGCRSGAHIHLAVIELVPASVVRPALQVGVRDLLLFELHRFHLSIFTADVSYVRTACRLLSRSQVVDSTYRAIAIAFGTGQILPRESATEGATTAALNRSAPPLCCRR